MASPQIPGIISQEQYDEYAANWLKIVSKAEGEELQQCFQTQRGSLNISSVDFPILQMVRLVSTVGAQRIKAHFLVKHDERTRHPHFTLALFATDAQDARVSSYYFADEYWTNSAEQPTTPQKDVVPDVLARYWAQTWAQAPKITPALFASSYGPLRGYTFKVADFMLPLRQLETLGDEKLRVDFGLHEYYRSEPDGDALALTFGLMLRLEGLAGQATEDPYYDLATPCPPSC